MAARSAQAPAGSGRSLPPTAGDNGRHLPPTAGDNGRHKHSGCVLSLLLPLFLTLTPPCLGLALAFFAALALALALALAALTSWGLAADDDLGPEPFIVNVTGIPCVQEMEE